MATLQSPPKLHSYVDHRPHSSADMFRKWNAKTYVDHWPALTDMRRVLLKKPRSYVDHYSQPGDLFTGGGAHTLSDEEIQAEQAATPPAGSATLALDATTAADMTITVIDATGWASGDTALLGGNTYQVDVADTVAMTLQLHFLSGPTPDGTVIPVGTVLTHG
jgi:hypothetical protein